MLDYFVLFNRVWRVLQNPQARPMTDLIFFVPCKQYFTQSETASYGSHATTCYNSSYYFAILTRGLFLLHSDPKKRGPVNEQQRLKKNSSRRTHPRPRWKELQVSKTAVNNNQKGGEGEKKLIFHLVSVLYGPSPGISEFYRVFAGFRWIRVGNWITEWGCHWERKGQVRNDGIF